MPEDPIVEVLNVKLPPELHARLVRAAKQRKRSKSAIVRQALDHYLSGTQSLEPARPKSALELAGDLAGCLAGPGDLSTNEKYMDGFGK
jgi:hypothetical protein